MARMCMRAYFVHPAAPGGLIFEFPGAFFYPFRLPPGSPKERKVALEESSTRIAVIGIIIEDRRQAEKINALLHQYGSYVIGRMGLPYEKKQVNIISVVLDAPMDVISALSGKLGRLPGVSSKALYSKASGTPGTNREGDAG